MHTVELQSLEKNHLLPPTTDDLSLDVAMLSEPSSCSDVDEDTCWGTEDEDESTTPGTSCVPRTTGSRILGGAAPFVPEGYENLRYQRL